MLTSNIPDSLLARGSTLPMAAAAGFARTAPIPIDGPATLPDFTWNGADSTSKPQRAPSRARAADANAAGGTPVDAPATIPAFSSEAGNTSMGARIQAAMEPEKVFGTDQSDVPLASPAQLALELARASAMAVRRAHEVEAATDAPEVPAA